MTIPDTADDGHLHVYDDDGYCVSCGHLQEAKHRAAMVVDVYDSDYDSRGTVFVSCNIHVEWEHRSDGGLTLPDLEAAVLAHVTEDQ